MSRPVYLIIFHSPIFAAHWALWVPQLREGKCEDTGKIISVQGSPSEGFVHEFERNYDLSKETRSHVLKLLCDIPSTLVAEATSEHCIDNAPIDELERSACKIQAPSPSLRSSTSVSLSCPILTRIKIQNCQTWLHEWVSSMVDDEVFPKHALTVLDQAPKN
ncbi:hypothetical protein BJ875DRAFT_417963 [Amylocarpus encephaloides]|uniref:Uncharacterized protein n=1 Tax=Amylocarpus encephaloides TaxID=45428 RepID=A0A9P7YQ26_9HELO|nr:hypothetical protein BJ875DRAFT_417963 [Amylocarpus encephaloides]